MEGMFGPGGGGPGGGGDEMEQMMKMMGGMGGGGGMGGMGGGGGGARGPTHDVDAVVPNQTIVDNLFKRSDEEFGGCTKEDIARALQETDNNKAGSAATVLRKRFA